MKTLYNQLWRISHHYLGDEEQNNPAFLFDFIHLAIYIYIYLSQDLREIIELFADFI